SDETGFFNALNGIYQQGADGSLYGQTLSWGMLSVLSQQYDGNDYHTLNTNEAYFYEYDYESEYTKPIIQSVWDGLYNEIAGCNLLLKEVEAAKPGMFTLDSVTRNLIMGETMALRAFFHFDIVRMFAPAPILQDQTPLIPYQAEWQSVVKPSLSVNDLLDKVLADLLKAKNLVALNDTIVHLMPMRYGYEGRFGATYNSGDGSFFDHRGYRMNYYAILGLLSKVYLYKGDTDNALRYASELYDNFVVQKKWLKIKSDYTSSENQRQKKHLDDCLFAFYNANLLTIYGNYTKDNDLRLLGVDDIYAGDENDYRKLYLLEKNEDAGYYTSLRYKQVGNGDRDNYEGRAIPVLRLSEIYHIMVECLYDKGMEAEALAILKELRMSRGANREIESVSGKDDLLNIIVNDARREFVGEGQLFFYYKRLNKGIKTDGSEIIPDNKIFTFKIPESQNVF
ncbi:MAG: RagB/SusD family nutrient uptake outer membrane protein, partial [Odoribacter sp.]